MRLRADLAFAAIAAIWGGTFVMVKTAVASAAVLPFMTVRFGLATLVLGAIAGRHLAGATRLEWAIGSLVGVFLGSGYILQTFGLQHISSSKAAFLTGLGTVLVPFIGIAFGHRPTLAALAAVAMAATGTALIGYGGEGQDSAVGEFLVVGCAVVFALHLAVQGEFAPRCDSLRLAVLQLASAAAVSAAGWGMMPQSLDPGAAPAGYTWHHWGSAAFLAVFATALAFMVQAWGQKFTTPTRTALLFSLEPVFGAIFGIWLDGDRLSPINWAGCAMILGGIVAGEWKPVSMAEEPHADRPAPASPPGAAIAPAAVRDGQH